MNCLLLIVLLIIGFSIFHGYRKGFLRIAYSLVAWLLMLVFVSWITPYISDFLVEKTQISAFVEEKCEEQLRKKAEEKIETNIEENLEDNIEGNIEETGEEAQNSTLADLGLGLPDSVSQKLYDQTVDIAGDMLDESGIYEGVAQGMTQFVVNGIAFFAALALAILISHVLQGFLSFVSDIPILGGINRFLGLFAGAVYGLCLVWLGLYLIALFGTSDIGQTLYAYIQQSEYLIYLYEHNPIITLILYFLS